MLPVSRTHRLNLADVLPSCRSSLSAKTNSLGLPAVRRAVVIVIDGLGAHALSARSGHARTLAPMTRGASIIGSGFPTTTAAALATLTTGVSPGEHGLVGYSVLDPANDRMVNQLNGWDDRMDPLTWQRAPTVFEQIAAEAIPSHVVATEKYRHSGFTRAVLRGAHYHAAASIDERLELARTILDSHDRVLVYVYAAELDAAGHSDGCESSLWTDRLEEIDGAVSRFAPGLRPDEGLLVTADHGVLDIPHRAHVLVDQIPGLLDGVRFIAGEPRCLQLHFEPDATADLRSRTIDHWRASEGHRAWVSTRAEAIDAGWFGPRVAPDVALRIGDVIVAARKKIAYYDGRAAQQSGRTMVGQHGSLSPAETNVPLVRFGAFAT